MLPDMLIPPRGGNSSAVTAVKAKPAICPRYPRTFHFCFRQSFQQFIIFLLFWLVEQHRCMPGTTYHRDVLKHLFLSLPDYFAHMRLTQVFEPIIFSRKSISQFLHRFIDGNKYFLIIMSMFKCVFPPFFSVIVSRYCCEK